MRCFRYLKTKQDSPLPGQKTPRTRRRRERKGENTKNYDYGIEEYPNPSILKFLNS